MKITFLVLGAICSLALFSLPVRAQVLFDPVFTPGSTSPAGYTLGIMASYPNGMDQPPVYIPQNGTVAFNDDGTMTIRDIAASGNVAYITLDGIQSQYCSHQYADYVYSELCGGLGESG